MKWIVLIFFTLFYINFVFPDEIITLQDSNYLFSVPHKKNWYIAYQYCRFFGMRLIDIPDQQEETRIITLINQLEGDYKTAEYWTSGTDLGRDGNNVWMSTGYPFVYSSWHNGQPDSIFSGNERENCVELRHWGSYKWNDHLCSVEKYFICKNETIFNFEPRISFSN